MASAERWSIFSYINYEKQIPVTKLLGRGGNGNVYGPCVWKNTLFAFKQIEIKCSSDSEYQGTTVRNVHQVIENLRVWSSLDHRNLMKVLYVGIDSPSLYIVMEYASGGTLTKALRSQSSPLPYSRVIDWAEQIANGMFYLHERSIVHGNLKSGNVMILELFDPKCIQGTTLKITDIDQMRGSNPKATECDALVALEVKKTGIVSKASDVWSYGVVLWEILTRQVPREVETINLNLAIPESCLGVLRNIFKGCWEQTKEKRPMFSEILSSLCDMLQDKELTEILKAERRTDYHESMTQEGKSEGESPNKDEDSVDYKMRLKQQMEKDEAARGELLKQSQPAIYGLSILNNEVFVSYLQSSLIAVYDSTTFNCNRRLTVSGLTNPEHIVSCNVYQCLYSFDWSYQGVSCEILRIDPYIGEVVKNWKTLEGGGRLSIANDTNIILNINGSAQLNEYTANGELLRIINLASGTGILQAWHAIKLDNGLFLVCHGDYGDPNSRVCLLSLNENSGLSDQRFDTMILAKFGDEDGNPLYGLRCPTYLAVDKDGSIIFCDMGAHRLLMLNSCLDDPRDLVPEGDTGVVPWRVCVDESNGRYLVAEYHRILSCKKLSDGQLEWQTLLE